MKRIALGAWDNLGRTGAEYAHLGELFDYDSERATLGRVEVEGSITSSPCGTTAVRA